MTGVWRQGPVSHQQTEKVFGLHEGDSSGSSVCCWNLKILEVSCDSVFVRLLWTDLCVEIHGASSMKLCLLPCIKKTDAVQISLLSRNEPLKVLSVSQRFISFAKIYHDQNDPPTNFICGSGTHCGRELLPCASGRRDPVWLGLLFLKIDHLVWLRGPSRLVFNVLKSMWFRVSVEDLWCKTGPSAERSILASHRAIPCRPRERSSARQ